MTDGENGIEDNGSVQGQDTSFSETIRKLRRIQLSVNKTFQEFSQTKGFQDSVRAMRDMHSTINEIQKGYERSRDLIENGIQNFEAPQQYDPRKFKVSNQTEELAIRQYASVRGRLNQQEDNQIKPYINRIDKGGKAYANGEYMLACFAIISAHDGLLSMICSERGMKMSGNGYYTTSDKREGLKEAYKDMDVKYFGVHEDQIIDTFDLFWDHRNAIMHGDPVAHFDQNIATVAMLFMAVTMNVVEDMLL